MGCVMLAPKSQKPAPAEKILAGGQRHRSGVGGQIKIRQPIRDGDSNLCAGRMHVLFGLAHVRTLLNEARRKTYRQFLWQIEDLKLKFCGQLLAGKAARNAASRSRC